MKTNYRYHTVPRAIYEQCKAHRDVPAQYYKDPSGTFHPITRNELWEHVAGLAVKLGSLGIHAGSHVGIISDNRWEWLVANLAILSCRACDVPRGSDSTEKEIYYILNHSECSCCFVENVEQCKKILSKKLPALKTLVLFDTEHIEDLHAKEVSIVSFSTLLTEGKQVPSYEKKFESLLSEGNIDDIASIIYTSGTTGTPKGIILTHKNFLFQLMMLIEYTLVQSQDVMLCILPIWHSFERIANYLGIYQGATLAYSEPVASVLLKDMKTIRPTVMASVPRIWEGVRAGVLRNVSKESPIKKGLFHFFLWVGTCHSYLKNLLTGSIPSFSRPRIRILDILMASIPFILLSPFRLLGNILVFSKIKTRLGGRFKLGVSGGSALPPYVATFFEAVGISLFEGYGLTEAAPVIAVNRPGSNIRGTVGIPMRNTEWKIIDENGEPTHTGELQIRSEQVMQGYYKDETATKRAISKDAWLHTGDLTIATTNGAIKIIGRIKDTIVLRNGENVEPEPIEQAICQSPYIDYAMVIGQDQVGLGAIIFPNIEMAKGFAKNELDSDIEDIDSIVVHKEFIALIRNEIKKFVNYAAGFRPFEQITRSHIAPVTLTVGEELSLTLKFKRFKLKEIYKSVIEDLYRNKP